MLPLPDGLSLIQVRIRAGHRGFRRVRGPRATSAHRLDLLYDPHLDLLCELHLDLLCALAYQPTVGSDIWIS